jgi:hypothetical protein
LIEAISQRGRHSPAGPGCASAAAIQPVRFDRFDPTVAVQCVGYGVRLSPVNLELILEDFMAVSARQEAQTSQRFEEMLARVGAKDRANIEKHLVACEAEPDPSHAQLWKRLAGTLASLAPLPPQAVGQQALLYFVPDGKYRMQVFALEDKRDGLVLLYLPNLLQQAVKEKILVKDGDQYASPDDTSALFSVVTLDSKTANPPQHVKHMIGWNRKAIMLTFHVGLNESSQLNAAEALCTLASKQWPAAAEKK